jgi:hypothetical protein
MTDLETMLSNAGRSGPYQDAAADVVDADVARAHRALVHRRVRRTGGRSLAVGALALGSFAVLHTQSGGQTATTGIAAPTTKTATTTKPVATKRATTTPAMVATVPTVPKTKTAASPAVHELAIKLVDYTGTQPPGYTVGSVPSGWDLQGVSNFALVIGPKGDADQELNDFQGKLVVMLASSDEPAHQTGTPVAVGDLTGVVRHTDPNVTQLFVTDAAGHHIDIQAPTSLHWSDAQVGAFAATVHVNPNAQAGVG